MKTFLALVLAGGFGFMAAGAADARLAATERKQEVDRLIEVVSSKGSLKDRADACRELARIGDKDAVLALAAQLDNPELSDMARYGLETIPDRSVDAALREALSRVTGRQLVGVIDSLAVRRDAEATDALRGLVGATDPDVAQAAARALGSIGTKPAAQALQAVWPAVAVPNQPAFAEALLRCAEKLAKGSGRDEALVIYDTLRGATTLPQVQAAAVRGLVLASGKRGLKIGVEGLAAAEPAVFQGSLRALQEMNGSGVTKALCEAALKLPEARQVKVIQTLGNRGESAALPCLTQIARAGTTGARIEAIKAMAQLGNPKAVPELVHLLQSEDPIVKAAQSALGGIPGKQADDAALQLLNGPGKSARVIGLELVARRRMVSALPDLLRMAQGNDPVFKVAATRQYGELGGADEVPALLTLLSNSSQDEEIEAVQYALESIGERTADKDAFAEQLSQSMAKATPAQAAALLRVLGANGGQKALQTVRSALTHPSEPVKGAALRVLANWSSAEAAPDLLKLARNAATPADKALALRGYLRLAGHADVSAEDKLKMCREAESLAQNADQKRLLLGALGSTQSLQALPLVLPYLSNGETREEAGNAIVSIAERVLRRQSEGPQRKQLVEPLEKVVQATQNEELGKRAKSALEQAKK